MVDLQTAMAAASAERRQRSGAASEERKVRRSGASLGLEPFDPVKHVSKEKADTASMWLVIACQRISKNFTAKERGLKQVSSILLLSWQCHFY
jgi:hypothetical protein